MPQEPDMEWTFSSSFSADMPGGRSGRAAYASGRLNSFKPGIEQSCRQIPAGSICIRMVKSAGHPGPAGVLYMIEADNLYKQFIRQEKKGKKTEFFAVDGISFKAFPGEILGVLGPNGAGKTTLLRMIGFLMEPTKGKVMLTRESEGSERKITDPVEAKKYIGYLSENTKLYGRFTIRELLQVFGGIYGESGDEIKDRTEKICSVLNMESFIDNRIEKLSTGQRQRASIARCLIQDPSVYIFDEPTLGLDVISSRSIIDFMKSERERHKTVLYSTHYMEEAENICDHIIMLDRGHIIAEGTPDELKEKTGTGNLRDTFFAITENIEAQEDLNDKD